MTLAIPYSLTEVFGRFIRGLLCALGTETTYQAQATGKALAIPVIERIGARVAALGRAFNSVLDRLRTGTLPKPRVRGEDAPPRAASFRAGVRPPANPFPYQFGWLVPKITTDRHVLGHWHNVFTQLLADPDMKAAIAAAPRQMERHLRPLCWMLGVDPRPLFPPRPRRGRGSGRAQADAVHAAEPVRVYRPLKPAACEPPPPPPVPTALELPDGRLIDLKTIPEAERAEFIRWALKPWTG